MKKTLLVIGIVAAVVFAAFNYHFILWDSGLKVLKKTSPTLDSTFVDARGTNRFKVFLNPALVKAGIKEALSDAGEAIK
jgi:hypothetical protein